MSPLPKVLGKKLDRFSLLRQLECDGMTRVASFLLDEARIAHDVCIGHVALIDVPRWVKNRVIKHHWWIEFEKDGAHFVIDYRARMWLGDKPFVAHGVFLKTMFPSTVYSPKRRGPLDVPRIVFEVLTRPLSPIPVDL
jgi:hypothetical protein